MTFSRHRIANVPALTRLLTVLAVIPCFARLFASVADETRFAFTLSRLRVASAVVQTVARRLTMFSVVPLGAAQLAKMTEISGFAMAMSRESVAHSTVMALTSESAIGTKFAKWADLMATVSRPSVSAMTRAVFRVTITVVFTRASVFAFDSVKVFVANLITFGAMVTGLAKTFPGCYITRRVVMTFA